MKKSEYQKLNGYIAWRVLNVIYGATGLATLFIYADKSLLTWSIPWYFKHINDINAIYFPTKELLIFFAIIIIFIIFYFILRHLTVYIFFNK